MASLVEELERDAYDKDASLSNMLRKAKAIAVKLQLQQPIEWVEAELNGYINSEVPAYRVLIGSAKVQNPYHGWQPVMFGDADMEKTICKVPIRSSMREIEDLLEGEGDPSIPLNGKLVQTLCRGANMPVIPIHVFFSRTMFVAITDAVRNKILDWSLSLQAAGIKGEGMSFLPEERAKVSGKGDTYNIGSIGSFAGNLGGQVGGNVKATSTNQSSTELEKVVALLAQLRTHRNQMGLDPNQQSEMDRHIDNLGEQLQDDKPSVSAITGLLKSIKAIAEGAAGNLVASGVVSLISGIEL